MQKYLRQLVTIFSLLGIVSLPVFAESSSNSSQDTAAIEAQLKKLEKEVSSLKQQVKSQHSLKKSKKTSNQPAVITQNSTSLPNDDAMLHAPHADQVVMPFDSDVPGQAFVSTGPYVNLPIQYSGSDLIINSPSVNTDVQLLKIRQSILGHLQEVGGDVVKEPTHSHLLFSGEIQGDAFYLQNKSGANQSYFDVPTVTLDATLFGPSDWLLGFIEFSYNNTYPVDSYYKLSNSRVYINRAFITVGDLQKSSFYSTLGQFYVPFGSYSSMMVSDPLTKLLARTRARSLLVGYSQQQVNAFYAAAYAFAGDSHAASASQTINNGGMNVGYKFDVGVMHGDVGGGVIRNLADSAGMQIGNGFGNSAADEYLVQRVPAYNLRALLNLWKKVDLVAEYVSASTAFNPIDMAFNGQGAKPWALDAEASYSFYILDSKPTSVGFGYTLSKQALSLGLPARRYSLVLNSSIWRNTLESLELRHDVGYSAWNTASGAQGQDTTTGLVPAQGGTDNAVTLELSYFF